MALSSCATSKPLQLPGHTKENLRNAPDVVLEVGESIQAVRLGLIDEKIAPAWGALIIDDEAIAKKVTTPDRNLWLYGVKAGKTKARYSPVGLALGTVRSGVNHDFWLIVRARR